MSAWSQEWIVRNRPAAGALFGLCAMERFVVLERPLTEAVIEITVGPTAARLPARAVVSERSEGAASVLFHVNTHLVPNGMQPISAAIIWPDGCVSCTPPAEYEIDNTGTLSASVAQELSAYGSPAIFGRTVDSALFPFASATTHPWFDAPLDGARPALSYAPARDAEAARRHLATWGFCVLNTTVPMNVLSAFNQEIDAAMESGTLNYRWGSSERIYGAHRLPHGRQVWLFPPVIRFLRDWFRDEPCPCQSLLYMFGSEQGAHQDTIHLTPYPAGYMCGVWVALEDVKPDSGELFVYPGSHRTKRLMSSDLNLAKVTTDYSSYAAFDRGIAELVAEGGFERGAYRPKAGEILVWHENLIHGGSKRLNPEVTRRSIVSHYFSRGGIAFYDSRGEAAFLEPVD